ncbi:MAG: universal stress protein [Pseudorhodoplanes sp.]
MKTILVPTEQHDLMNATLEAALVLARLFDSHIEGFAIRQALADFLVADPYGGIAIDVVKQNEAEVVAQAKSLFEGFMTTHSVPVSTVPTGAVSCHWSESVAEGENALGSYGRVFDIMVLGRPGFDLGDPRKFTFETALFETGRPIMLAPRNPPKKLGDDILVSWNASTEQARTTAFAMPLLQRAKRVTVLTVAGGSVSGPTGEDMARSLRFNQIPAQAVTADPQGKSVGEATLAYAEKEGFDLLVKGAYTQSRLRQMIFGGATRHIIENANIPVFMAH